MRRQPVADTTRSATQPRPGWRGRPQIAVAVVVATMAAGLPATAVAGKLTVRITSGTGQISGPLSNPCVREDATAPPTVCTYDVDETFDVGLSAVLDEFRAVRWEEPAACGAEEFCTVPVGGVDRQASVAFEPGPANLTVQPNLQGGVRVDPPGVPRGSTQDASTCAGPPIQPSQCSWDYPRGTVVTVTPLPDAGAGAFVGWSTAECAGLTACTLRLDDGSTTAVVTYSVMHLALAPSDSIAIVGTAGGVALSCPGQCDADLPYGTSVTLTAQPIVPTATPVRWFRGCEEGYDHLGPTCTVVANLTPTWVIAGLDGEIAPFLPPVIAVTFQVRKQGQGTVRGAKIDCGHDCSSTYDYGTKVNLTADPDAGWDFDHWIGGCGRDATCRLTLGPTTSVRAIFTPRAGSASTTKGADDDKPPPVQPPQPPLLKEKAKPLLSHLTVQRMGHGRTRRIVVAFDLRQRAKVAVGLTRTHARRRSASVSRTVRAGHRRLTLKVPRRLRAGSYRLDVRASVGGDRSTIVRSVRLRR